MQTLFKLAASCVVAVVAGCSGADSGANATVSATQTAEEGKMQPKKGGDAGGATKEMNNFRQQSGYPGMSGGYTGQGPPPAGAGSGGYGGQGPGGSQGPGR